MKIRKLAAASLLLVGSLAVNSCSTPDSTAGATKKNCPTAEVVSGQSPWSPGSGWRQIFFDDFDRCELGKNWSTYDGKPGGNPVGRWDPANAIVSGGMLKLVGENTADGWRTGGVSNFPVTQLYGRWEIRMRAQPSADLSYHMLLWPKNEQWPPEIDFAESVSADRRSTEAWIHWKDAQGQNAKTNTAVRGDFTKWHTIGVEWLPGIVRYLLDGRVWAEARSDRMVSKTPMWMALQTEAGACERRLDWGMAPCAKNEPRPKKAAVEIDWVVVYRPNGDVYQQRSEDGYGPRPGAVQLTES
ncbi:MAG: glycoside hydrolase family 16 protein [Gordonia sp. (in: high G+C Gram-positive bacteria)]|uniref:glycoside hydrolase family 16 protein n=1 Tax=Gordonia sp. (in: high G+C Gram-positive bacteria) TaxID=84139 RepID=UPI0039E45C33